MASVEKVNVFLKNKLYSQFAVEQMEVPTELWPEPHQTPLQ